MSARFVWHRLAIVVAFGLLSYSAEAGEPVQLPTGPQLYDWQEIPASESDQHREVPPAEAQQLYDWQEVPMAESQQLYDWQEVPVTAVPSSLYDWQEVPASPAADE